MARLINAYTIQPSKIKPGDVMLFTVKAMVMRETEDGRLLYRLYCCAWDGDLDDVPQGSQIADMEGVCKEIFPSLASVGEAE